MSPKPPAASRPTGSRVDGQLIAAVEVLAGDANELLELEMRLPETAAGSMTTAARLLASVSATTLARVEELEKGERMQARKLASLALRTLELQDAVHDRIAAQRERTYMQMREGLDRLRRIASSAALLDRVCHEVVDTCGFSRAMLTRVEREEWLPWMAYFSDDRELELRFVEWMNRQRFPVSAVGGGLLRLRPVIVRDALSGPEAFAPMVRFSKTPCYVAAPVRPAGRLVGILYADRYPTGQPVDDLDRDVLGAFAEGFGRIYGRAVLIERMRAQRAQVNRTFEFAENMMTSLANAEIEFSRAPEDRIPSGEEPEPDRPPAPPLVKARLTTREGEVLALMVRGASNAAIAEQLIIKEGTVKSHVKHILRKLDAANRAEAIFRYLGG